MNKPLDKFVTSKYKLYLINSLILFLLIPFIISFINLFNDKIIFMFTLVLSLIFLLIAFIIKSKIIYHVYVYSDKLVFKNCFRKIKECRFIDILEVCKITLSREGSSYVLITENENKIFKFEFPFKLDVNNKTTKIINSFWNKEIKTIL